MQNFLEKLIIRAIKFIILLLNCTLGPPDCTIGIPSLGVKLMVKLSLEVRFLPIQIRQFEKFRSKIKNLQSI